MPRHQRPDRGRGWQEGQLNADRFMNLSCRISDPHRLHGRFA